MSEPPELAQRRLQQEGAEMQEKIQERQLEEPPGVFEPVHQRYGLGLGHAARHVRHTGAGAGGWYCFGKAGVVT